MIAQAISNGYNVDELNNLTNIDKWFLIKMQNIVVQQRHLEVGGVFGCCSWVLTVAEY